MSEKSHAGLVVLVMRYVYWGSRRILRHLGFSHHTYTTSMVAMPVHTGLVVGNLRDGELECRRLSRPGYY